MLCQSPDAGPGPLDVRARGITRASARGAPRVRVEVLGLVAPREAGEGRRGVLGDVGRARRPRPQDADMTSTVTLAQFILLVQLEIMSESGYTC